MKCLRTLLRSMSHFSSPRRSTGRGAPSVKSSTQRESNQPARRNLWIFDGDCPIRATENLVQQDAAAPDFRWIGSACVGYTTAANARSVQTGTRDLCPCRLVLD